jgi:S-adenosylmethionine hydrolase
LKNSETSSHGQDIFAPVAAFTAQEEKIEKFGNIIDSYKTLEIPKVKITPGVLAGEIMYIDRFGNLKSY